MTRAGLRGDPTVRGLVRRAAPLRADSVTAPAPPFMPRLQAARLLIGATSLLAVLACNLARPPQAQGPTGATSPAAASAGIPVSATPIRFSIPDGLATGATAETIDVVTEQTGAPWDIAPPHLQLTLPGHPLPARFP